MAMLGNVSRPHRGAAPLIGSVVALATVAVALLPPAWAQDSQSAMSFFVSEAARAAPPVARPAPVVPAAPLPMLAPVPRSSPERGRTERAVQGFPSSKARYARLPQPTEAAAKPRGLDATRKLEAEPKKPQAPVRLDLSDPIKAVLKDPTLQAGDIVIFPDGARVFTGKSKGPHRLSSFEDAGSSQLVPKSSRVALAGLSGTATKGANTPARLRAPLLPTGLEAKLIGREDGPRVVYQDGRVAQRP